ncbi:hypothetical protein SAMN03080617_00860 [Algoriphagus alkaliphilus]|uniref:Uncharacterized protein n=1 Tax=Algoriphagus alkaliphilus TaxID=279824 RepID=A0A1G5W281_9BACT|nr:hypothetical protein SAMN03080617_00860 [Algoriphagus alkaliphilus]
MLVPDKFTLDLDQFDVLVVELTDDLWGSMIVETGEFISKIYLFHF